MNKIIFVVILFTTTTEIYKFTDLLDNGKFGCWATTSHIKDVYTEYTPEEVESMSEKPEAQIVVVDIK